MIQINQPSPLFSLGQTVATPGALEAFSKAQQTPKEFLDRHARGDWGQVCGEDAEANDNALLDEGRLLSAYCTSLGVRLWVITEADRSATTVLRPEEY